MDWMVKRVSRLTGLGFDQNYLESHLSPNAFGKGVESRTALYKDSVVYPYQRLINQIVPGGKGIEAWFRTTFPPLARRNVPPAGFRTINEMLHISALARWTKPVVCDCPENKECAPRAYRPLNLEAVIRAREAGYPIPVAGWDGNVLEEDAVPWPRALAT